MIPSPDKNASPAPANAPPARCCANCSNPVTRTGTSAYGAAIFCCKACKSAFNNVMLKRGAQLAVLMQVARIRNPGPDDKATVDYAWREACRAISQWNAEDKDCGRSTLAVVRHREARGWSPTDY